MADIVPTNDADFDFFQGELVSKSVTNASVWGIPPAAITAIQASQTPWTNAWLVAKDPDDSTQTDIEAKNDARDAYEPDLRQFIQQWIQNNKKVSDTDRVSMGIKPRKTTRTKSTAPTIVPVLDLKAGSASSVKVNIRHIPEGQTESKKGKPEGAKRCEIKYKVADKADPAPVSYLDCPDTASSTGKFILLEFDATDAGKRIYIYGHFLSPTEQSGPYTVNYVTMLIPG